MDILDIYASDTGGLLGQNQGAGQLPTIPPNLHTKVPTVMPAAPNLLSTMSQAWAQANQPDKSLGLVLADAVQAMPRMHTQGLIARQNAKVAAQKAEIDHYKTLMDLQASIAALQKTGVETKKAELQNRLINQLFPRSGATTTGAGQTTGDLANISDDQLAAISVIFPGLADTISENKKRELEQERFEWTKGAPEREQKKEAETKRLKFNVDARANFGSNYSITENAIGMIDRLANHPELPNLLGSRKAWTEFKKEILEPGSPLADVYQLVEAVKAPAFLAGFEGLKGGGSITQTEGEKAERAITNLDTNQGIEQFRQSLEAARAVFERGFDRAIIQAGFENLPRDAVPIGADVDDNNVYRFGSDLVAAPPSAKYTGQENGEYIFTDKGKTLRITPKAQSRFAKPSETQPKTEAVSIGDGQYQVLPLN